MPHGGRRKRQGQKPQAVQNPCDVWELLTEVLGADPTSLGVRRGPIQSFSAYVFARPEPVPRSAFLPKVFGVYDGIPYYRPDGWWQLRVEPFCAHGYIRAKSDFDEIKDWPIAYHGTTCDKLASILGSGLRKPGELEGVLKVHGGSGAGPNGSIYLSPSLWYSSHPVYSGIKEVGHEMWAQAVLKLRVRPGSYRTQGATLNVRHWNPQLSFDPNLPGEGIMEWLFDGSSVRRTDCVIVGLMVRLIGQAVPERIFGQCPPLSSPDTGRGQGPEYNWTRHLEQQFRTGGYLRDNSLVLPYAHVAVGACNGAGDDPDEEVDARRGDGVLRDRRGVSTAEAASQSAEELEASGLAAIIEKVLAEIGASLVSGKWQLPPRLEKDMLGKVRRSLTRGEPIRDSEDARSRYNTVLDFIRAHAESSRPLDVKTLLGWHGLYMKGIHGLCGQLRDRGVVCGEYPYMSPAKLPAAVEEYASEATRVAAREDLSAPTKAAWCHYHIVRIHPFADGNGRMGRLVAIWALARHGLPWKMCLAPLFEEDNAAAAGEALAALGCEGVHRLDVSRSAYFEAHLIAARHHGAQSGDIRPFATHVCKCIVAALHACQALPPGFKLEAVSESLKRAQEAAVASSSQPTVDWLANGKNPYTDVPAELRLTAMQRRILSSFADEAAGFDPVLVPERNWSHLMRDVAVCDLQNAHRSISATFRQGPHAGQSVSGLADQLRNGYLPSNLPPLVAVEWEGKIWVIMGNRRLHALKDSVPSAVVRVIVHPLNVARAPLFAKFLVAMSTESGGAVPSICEDCVSESSATSILDSDTSTP